MNRIGLSQRLELRQSQSLVMTPQLQQAIKLLQLSNLELGEFVEAEIEKNPLLEHGEPQRDEAPSGARRAGRRRRRTLRWRFRSSSLAGRRFRGRCRRALGRRLR